MDVLIVILLGIFLVLIYFLPALVANRKHPHAAAIAVVNLFFGWTLLGWVGCLVWALIGRKS